MAATFSVGITRWEAIHVQAEVNSTAFLFIGTADIFVSVSSLDARTYW